ncbi:MAG: MmgE/PrpD family protein [Actinobacteria bacterium]|nr:MmgE/PrpD family protein [Actinomycetota bacterium]
MDDFLAAVAVGYEVAIRAGLALHRREAHYHASGAWGAVGAAAAAARLLRLGDSETRHAIGLAEYHAPIAPVMRSVAAPAMTKDACGWGAFLGTSSALLAAGGFTAVPSAFLGETDGGHDLGARWHVLDVYVKEFPCCRWSHAPIRAALDLRRTSSLEADRIARVEVRSFAQVAEISRRLPRTTEEAQYSVVWPVAVALAHGRFGVEDVREPAFADSVGRELTARVDVTVDPSFDRAFPGRRLAQVRIERTDGVCVSSRVTEPPGEPDDPRLTAIVEAKVAAAEARPRASELPDSLSHASLAELVIALTSAEATEAATDVA